jgi:hypothetical protein
MASPFSEPPLKDPPPPEKPRAFRAWAAVALAAAADGLQLLFIPAFGAGALSPFEDVLDVAVGLSLVALLGWHWEFLPAFGAELIPGVDLAPTWTASVLWVLRRRR